MSQTDTDSLTKSQVKEMTSDELVTLVMDCLKKLRERCDLRSMNTQKEDLEKAHKQIEHIDSIAKELNSFRKQNKNLESQQIPKLKHEVKHYRDKVKELETSLEILETVSKLQAEKAEKEKRQMMSEITAYKVKVKKHQSEMKKLESEMSRKIDDIIMKNEIMREKDKRSFLEGKVEVLEKQLKEAEEKNEILKLSKTSMEGAIDKNEQKFKARIDLTEENMLAEEKQLNRIIVRHLMRQERQVSELVEQQREAVAVRESLDQTKAECRDLKKENESLNSQIKVLTKDRKRQENHMKVTDQVLKVTELYIGEKMKHENLKDSTESNESLEGPTEDSKVKTQTNNKQLRPQPPIQKKKLQLPQIQPVNNRRSFLVGEGKSEFNLRAQENLKPPSKRKPERPACLLNRQAGRFL